MGESKKVYIDMSCWYGYSLGAKHYYVQIRAQGVPFVDQDKRFFREKFDTYEQAKNYINRVIQEHFTGCELVSTGETELHFLYDRIGD